MATPATVIYFKDEQVKNWLKSKAKASNKSLSNIITEILTDNYKVKKQNNLIQFAGILKKKLSKKDLLEYDKAMEDIRKDRHSKPDSFYANLI